MQVKFIVLTPRREGTEAELGIESIANACRDFGLDPQFKRIAFGGRTMRGRGGVTLTIRDGSVEIGGHKLEPISADLAKEAVVFDASRVRDAFQEFCRGMSVLIRAEDGNAILLRWDPVAPEVFAVGNDSA